jgi:trigger factor
LDITLDKKSSTEALIKITLKETDYQPNVEEKVKEYARKVSIKGFRPGKVPPGLIRKMYGKSIKVEEINKLLSDSVRNYIKENDLKLIGEPLPDMEKAETIDWENQNEFEFDYNIGLIDDFSYDLSDKQKVTSYKIDMDKKTMDETLDNLKEQFGNVTNPEKAEKGDDFYGNLVQKEGDLENEGLVKWSYLSKSGQKKLLALAPGDSVDMDIQKDFEDAHAISHALNVGESKAKELSGDYTFTLKNINHTEPATLNQDLFDKVFGPGTVEGEEAFIEKVKQTVEENYNRETGYFLDHQIREHLLKETKIEVPDEFLKRWIKVSNENKVTDEDIEREYEEYVKSMKWDLIRNRIAEDHEIKVEHEEVVNRTKSMILQQLGGAGAASQLMDHMDAFADNYLKAENGQNYMKVYGEVRDEKVNSLIKEKMTIKEKKVSLEEFKKIVEKES